MADLDELLGKTMMYASFLHQPVRRKSFFFRSFRGTGNQGILRRLYDSMQKLPESQEYSFYWSISKPGKAAKELCAEREISLIPWENEEYLQLLATCEYLISDLQMPAYFLARKEQTYWNLTAIRGKKLDSKDNSSRLEEYTRQWRHIQSYLQSSHILATDASEVELLEEEYHLENLYTGVIYEIEGVHQQESQLELLRDVILERREALASRQVRKVQFPVRKHRLLFQIDWNRRDYLREWVLVWLQYVDYEKYDVTFMTDRPRNIVDMYKLTKLPKQVRVMLKSGYLLADAKQREEYRQFISEFWQMTKTEMEKTYPELEKLCWTEWKRIFGCACYDIIVFSDLHPIWYLGAEKYCARRIFLCTREMDTARRGSSGIGDIRENKWAAIEQMDAAFGLGSEIFPDSRDLSWVQQMPRPVPLQEIAEQSGRLEILKYQGREYALLTELEDLEELRGQVEFIPLPPADGQAYVAWGEIERVLSGFSQIRKEKPDSLLYVFIGDYPDTTDTLEEELRDSIVPIGGLVCGNMPGAAEYFQRFGGCLTDEEGLDSPLVSLMGLLGKPVYQVDGTHVKEIPVQAEREKLYAQGVRDVSRLWEGQAG